MVSNHTFILAGVTSVGDIGHHFWPIAALSFGVSLLCTPLCRKIALRYGIVDKPDNFLKPHQKPIPYLGGVAIFLGWLAGILITLVLGGINVRVGLMGGVALAGLAIMLVGLFDDLRFMQPKVKLTLNILVALWLLWLGLGDKLVHVATDFMRVQFSPSERWLELAYSVPVALLIVLGACNATNLIDGLDGLCTGVLGIISIGFFILAAHMRLYGDIEINNERIVFALAMLGAAAGFLPFNLNPAKIFMGDAGSMLLGLNAAVIMLTFQASGAIRWMSGALMIFGLPIAD